MTKRSSLWVLGVYAAISVILGYLSLESPLRTPVSSLLLLFVGGLAVILAAQRYPVAAVVGALVLLPASFAAGSGAEVVLVVAVLYATAASGQPRRAWSAFGLVIASSAVAALILAFRVRVGPPLLGLAPRADSDAWPLDWLSATTVAIVIALICTLVGLNVGHRRNELIALVERADQLRRERDQESHLAAARERERISREMHDVIAHSLAVMIALADGAQASVDSRPEESRRAIGRIADTGRQTLSEMRRLLTAVRNDEDALHHSTMPPGVDRLPALIEEARSAGLAIRFEQTGVLAADAVVGLTVYRIVQEALTNVLRHARGVREVRVTLAVTDDDVSILVEDLSDPAPPGTDPGRGLVGIRERAAFYDGHVETGPRPGGGWRVFAHLRMES
ncbi:histidine kinase [Microbacterium aurantiacum]|uniref:histidine kinase n=1 Tax=Microbacterium aurantiacum TaxID=162393 RepID=UPI0034439CEC